MEEEEVEEEEVEEEEEFCGVVSCITIPRRPCLQLGIN